jgi:enoyl-CoA hydratase/carnithine racemase
MREVDTGTNELLCAVDNGVATITLNRPEKRNALSDRLTPALRNVLPALEADVDVRVVVVTGAGKAFCSGGDVSGMGDRRAAPTSTEAAIRTLRSRQETLTLRLFELAKPTIAALPGAAAGAGMSIALACDLRIAAESSFLTTAFANVGLSGDYGGSWLLTQLVGTSRAKELYYTARRVSAAEALGLGLVNEVVPDDRLMARTKELAEQIAAGPPIAIGYMKENLNRALAADLKSALALEADRMVRCNQTEDHREAVRAFLEKRRPSFRGR